MEKNKLTDGITAVVAISDFEAMDYVPYEESIISSFNLAEKTIVVYGGSIRKDNRTPVLATLQKLTKEYNIEIKYFPWPEKYNWTQFSKSYAYGRSFINTKWCMCFTSDEIFPERLRIIKKIIRFLPYFVDYISLNRFFLITKQWAVEYVRKRIIFRNRQNITFGIVSHKEIFSNFRDFMRPVDIRKFYDGNRYVRINDNLSRAEIERHHRGGILLKGFRDRRFYKTLPLPFYYINTHTLFMPKEYIYIARKRSFNGYENLPENYRISFQNVDPYGNFLEKIEMQLITKKKRRIKFPSGIKESIMKNYQIEDEVLNVVKKYDCQP